MEITNVRINPAIVKDNGFLAYVNVTFDNCFSVTGFRLFFSANGYELFVPAKKMRSGQRLILADSLTTEMKHRIETAVIAEYEKVSGETLSSQPAPRTRHEI